MNTENNEKCVNEKLKGKRGNFVKFSVPRIPAINQTRLNPFCESPLKDLNFQQMQDHKFKLELSVWQG